MFMPKLEPKTIASKAIDIQKGLQDVSVSIPHYYFNKTLRVGKSIHLAANIRGFEVIRPFDRLEMMAIELGIDPDQLRASILPTLEELDTIRIHRNSAGKISRIEETVPPIKGLLRDFGKYWNELEPNVIEKNGIQALNTASTCPIPLQQLRDDLGELGDNDFDVLMDCGKSGRFLSDYQSQTQEVIVYSPMIWNLKSEEILNFYSMLSGKGRLEISKFAEEIKNYPGLPLESVSLNKELLGEALACGFIERGSTVTGKGTRNFLFFPTPEFKLRHEGIPRGDAFDKVKAIISCVRHGQHYAEITRIRYPSLLLERLLERGYLNPHSESRDQYAILELNGVMKIEKVGSRWKPVLINTDENKEALKAAIDIISTGEPITQKLVKAQARSLLVSGSFIDPVRNRARTKKLPVLSQASLKDMLERLRGESIEY